MDYEKIRKEFEQELMKRDMHYYFTKFVSRFNEIGFRGFENATQEEFDVAFNRMVEELKLTKATILTYRRVWNQYKKYLQENYGVEIAKFNYTLDYSVKHKEEPAISIDTLVSHLDMVIKEVVSKKRVRQNADMYTREALTYCLMWYGFTLAEVANIKVSDVHGACIKSQGKVVYITNDKVMSYIKEAIEMKQLVRRSGNPLNFRNPECLVKITVDSNVEEDTEALRYLLGTFKTHSKFKYMPEEVRMHGCVYRLASNDKLLYPQQIYEITDREFTKWSNGRVSILEMYLITKINMQ